MTIHIDLSTESIDSAIRKLEDVKADIEQGTHDLVDILTREGAIYATAKYGGMAFAEPEMVTETHGKIGVSGKNDVTVYIAEFGAGDATIEENPFENDPGVEVYKGSYSELLGSGDYARDKVWHFGGQEFHEVPPRAGLRNARDYIVNRFKEAAKEVFQFD